MRTAPEHCPRDGIPHQQPYSFKQELEEGGTFPRSAQLCDPLSERLRLAVQVVLLRGPEMVTVSGVERLPQITGSMLAAYNRQVLPHRWTGRELAGQDLWPPGGLDH